jgi:hypothetical protein
MMKARMPAGLVSREYETESSGCVMFQDGWWRERIISRGWMNFTG